MRNSSEAFRLIKISQGTSLSLIVFNLATLFSRLSKKLPVSFSPQWLSEVPRRYFKALIKFNYLSSLNLYHEKRNQTSEK